jgi:acetoin utilization deacetylase AcuC-like enzyme
LHGAKLIAEADLCVFFLRFSTLLHFFCLKKMLKIAFSPIYKYELPDGHRFPMVKYELIPEQLLYEGTVKSENFFHPKPLEEATIVATHCADYWHRLRDLQLTAKEIRKIGFPMSARLIERCIHIADGTVQCALFAQQYGVAMNIAGGTHHAFTDSGEGFCMLNDVAIAANYLIQQRKAKRILVIDLDVHQGNGTAEIFQKLPSGWNETTQIGVFTFSMHGEKNYPLHKEPSNLDIGLPDGCDDAHYLNTLERTLKNLLTRIEPDFLFFNSGVDVLATDKLGRLALTLDGCKRRDQLVLSLAQTHQIPIAISMGGGYSERITHIVEAHANTFRVAQELFF